MSLSAISSISKLASCCIVARDLSKNTMKLDVIFFEDKNKRSAVLGLRRDKSGVFKPVTLHFTSAKKYAKVRKNRYERNEMAIKIVRRLKLAFFVV